jgi:SAM-dependent methyltransferase
MESTEAFPMHERQIAECKICGGRAVEKFSLPKSKLTGHPIPALDSDCPYFECTDCRFLFSSIMDSVDPAFLYDEAYWEKQDPDWSGRVNQTFRLVLMANKILSQNPWELKVLDLGCGMGTFIAAAREQLQMNVWGHDIIKPVFGKEWFVSELQVEKYDVIVACEVIEHFSDPVRILTRSLKALRPGGVFAFQTAYYDPLACNRDWWYLGPANGHVSLYSREAFEKLAQRLNVVEKLMWNDYPGLQAWRISDDALNPNV